MKSILVAGLVALVVAILGTPIVISMLHRRGMGQEVRTDGPQTHLIKQGTPTMGGIVIILGTVLGYVVAHLLFFGQGQRGPTASGVLVLYLMVGLGFLGFLDDYIKVHKQRSLGLNKTAKIIGQVFFSVSFGVLALHFKNVRGLSPGSVHLSFIRDIGLVSLGTVGFVVFALLLITGFSNAVNLTDGLDGLAAGSCAMVFGAYVVIAFYQFRNGCGIFGLAHGCYEVRDPLDIALIAAAAMGSCFGFLWWNAHPARIIMGDTGSLSLGGLMAGIAIVSRTELLLVILGSLFVIEVISDVIQVTVFKATRRRVFNMAPIHHHFELAGWKESTVIVRFWIITGIAVAFGLGVFYAEFISNGLHQ